MKVHELTNGNKILVGENVSFNEKNILFTGKGGGNNIAVLDKDLQLHKKSTINFGGSNSVAFLSSNTMSYCINISVANNQALYFGKNIYLNPNNAFLRVRLSEQKHLIIGDRCRISFGVWIRFADHPVYSIDTHERINPSKSVFIGDRVWLGQNALILNGTHIGSGSIIGAHAVVSGKKIPSNTSWAGNPARQVKDKIFWVNGLSNANWTNAETAKYQVRNPEAYTFSRDESTCSFDELDRRLTEAPTADDKLNILLELSNNTAKNRFTI